MLDEHATDRATLAALPAGSGTSDVHSATRPRRRRTLTLALAALGLGGVGVLVALGLNVDDGPAAAPESTPTVAATEAIDSEAIDSEAADSGAVDSGAVDSEAAYAAVSGQPVDTPCWSYEGPATFVNNIPADDSALCYGALELWGEMHGGGVVPTGFGTVYGRVKVEPVRVSTSNSWAPGTDVGAVVDALADTYFPAQGEILTLHEEATLDGVPANITRVVPTSAVTQTKAFITAFAPQSYSPGPDEVRLFMIAIVTPYDNGDELIQQVLDTWRWA